MRDQDSRFPMRIEDYIKAGGRVIVMYRSLLLT
jgi:hypothetical protein